MSALSPEHDEAVRAIVREEMLRGVDPFDALAWSRPFIIGDEPPELFMPSPRLDHPTANLVAETGSHARRRLHAGLHLRDGFWSMGKWAIGLLRPPLELAQERLSLVRAKGPADVREQNLESELVEANAGEELGGVVGSHGGSCELGPPTVT